MYFEYSKFRLSFLLSPAYMCHQENIKKFYFFLLSYGAALMVPASGATYRHQKV
jgi:hypothetical protein